MKKTLKSILALTLVLVMSMGTLTVFAAEGDILEWIFDGEYTTEYTYFGELKEGKNTVICSEETSEYKYYTFDAKEGCYLFSCTTFSDSEGWIDGIRTPYEIENGKAYDSADCLVSTYTYDDTSENFSIIYKLNAGENIIGIETFCWAEEAEIDLNVEYLGQEITDFDISDKELLLNSDIYEGSCGDELNTDLIITFDGTKTVKFEDEYVYFSCDEVKEGENTLTFEFGDITKDITVIANPIEYYIKDIELLDAEHYAQVFVDYNNDTWIYNLDGAAATVTFADGSEKDVFFEGDSAEVTLSNGKTYYIWSDINYSYDDGERYLCLYIADYEKEYKCTVVEFNILENGEILVDDTKSDIADFLRDIYWELDDATYFNTISEIFESLFGSAFDTLIGVSDLFGNVFENIILFIKFYLVG